MNSLLRHPPLFTRGMRVCCPFTIPGMFVSPQEDRSRCGSRRRRRDVIDLGGAEILRAWGDGEPCNIDPYGQPRRVSSRGLKDANEAPPAPAGIVRAPSYDSCAGWLFAPMRGVGGVSIQCCGGQERMDRALGSKEREDHPVLAHHPHRRRRGWEVEASTTSTGRERLSLVSHMQAGSEPQDGNEISCP